MQEKKDLIVQGRLVKPEDISLINQLMVENPDWHRTRLSRELCSMWNWRGDGGNLKDMACRSLLLKLEGLDYIQLPKALSRNNNSLRCHPVEPVLHSKEPIHGEIKELYPIEIRVVERGYELNLFKYFISRYHYLGWSGTVGENMKYLFFDHKKRPLGCFLFGAAAWKVLPRDNYIGWSGEVRKQNLLFIANNQRYLILPWVKVLHLASHMLGKICTRINQDWVRKYNHPIYLLETFVEKARFRGICYKAANWIYVGDTKGRGKLDVKKQYLLPIKSIWVYPLTVEFREKMICARVQV